MAKACNYALSANVDTLVTAVTIQHPASYVSTPVIEHATLLQVDDWLCARGGAEICKIDLYNPQGVVMATAAENRLWIGELPQGLYIAKVFFANGRNVAKVFVKE